MDRRTLFVRAAAALIATACGTTSGSGASGGTATNAPSAKPATKATVELAKGGSFTIALRPDKATLASVQEQVVNVLRSTGPDVQVKGVAAVGPQVGEDLAQQGVHEKPLIY